MFNYEECVEYLASPWYKTNEERNAIRCVALVSSDEAQLNEGMGVVVDILITWHLLWLQITV